MDASTTVSPSPLDVNTVPADLTAAVLQNTAYRRVLRTFEAASPRMPSYQVVAMALGHNADDANRELGVEIHRATVQYFLVKSGSGVATLRKPGEQRGTSYTLKPGDPLVVEPGVEHNVDAAAGEGRIQLLVIYYPPHHPPGTVDLTRAAAEEREAAMGQKCVLCDAVAPITAAATPYQISVCTPSHQMVFELYDRNPLTLNTSHPVPRGTAYLRFDFVRPDNFFEVSLLRVQPAYAQIMATAEFTILESLYDISRRLFLFAVYSSQWNKYVGLVMYYWPSSDVVRLTRFFIDEAYQRKGYGSAVIELLGAHFLMQSNAAPLTLALETNRRNVAAMAFFAKHGFEFDVHTGLAGMTQAAKVLRPAAVEE